jgi:predicted O-methyltransferase YrrM
MVKYDLSHLTQNDNQDVIGPIQDDEALFLYSIILGCRCKYILEIGGLDGYSATNFSKALEKTGGTIYTIDINPVKKVAPNHTVITKDAKDINSDDIDFNVLDLVFFDCHDYDVQMKLYKYLLDKGHINNKTIIALHDTNTHPRKVVHWAYLTSQGWVHQHVEREMVNSFKELGYDVFNLHTKMEANSDLLPFRHGVSILTLNKRLAI